MPLKCKPDIIGGWNFIVKSVNERVEEWVYYSPGMYIYFYEEDGRIWKEKKLTELDKLSIDGKVDVGMDETQVRRAKGEPSYIDRRPNEYNAQEKWTYGSIYVWFKSGKVVHYQK